MQSFLSCTDPNQLADFCALAVPSIWGQHQLMNRTIDFQQFCHKLIKATRISCACVVLALYYIHRLRLAYPYIHASMGSEIRLFTTALVLANKYLDDNTFTNKTWSEVSSIPTTELNIMEMEFLSALHYNIHVPDDQYFQWVGQCQQWMIMQPLCHQQQYVSTPSFVSTIHRTYREQEEDNHNKKMPYTPPESFQPIPCYDDYFCRPILSWSSSYPSYSTTFRSLKIE
ncbi:cyclin-domain-containing protein [Chlamydoabsidia padenii]|nr:cyclin-domain-containing protein [Chlamydoabsidia padenii]